MRLGTPPREVMLCTRVGHIEVETHHPTILDMGGSQNGSVEIPI